MIFIHIPETGGEDCHHQRQRLVFHLAIKCHSLDFMSHQEYPTYPSSSRSQFYPTPVVLYQESAEQATSVYLTVRRALVFLGSLNWLFLPGVVYLEPKGSDLRILHPEMVSPVHELINGTISVGEYLFSCSPTHRHLLLEHLQSRLLEGFMVDNKLTLREYIKSQSSSTASLSIVGALENLLVRTSSGSLEVTPRPGSTLLNNRTQKAHLEGHPHRLVSLDEIIHSVRISLSKADSLPIQLILPETIPILRARLSTYSTSIVVECQVPYLLKLAHALFGRYLQNQQRDDLDEAICYYEEASTSMTPIASYRHVEALLGLCFSLYQRLHLTGRFEDLVDLVKGLEAQADIDYAELLQGESMSSKNAQRQSCTVFFLRAKINDSHIDYSV